MKGKDNLIPFSERSKEEASEYGRKGGIASGETRRKKRYMKQMLEMCLEMNNKDGMSYRQLVTMGLIKGAIKGNAQNYRTILETLGELQPEEQENKTPTININVVDNSNLEEYMYKGEE